MKYVQVNKEGRIGYIILNRAEKRNALNAQFVTELKQAFSKMEDDPDIKVVILKAEGKAFCAGADLSYIKELENNSFRDNLEDSIHLKELFYKIYTLKKIVIAQVEGHAIAGGCGLVTVCDFAFAVPEAKFGYTEVRIGFIPALVMIFLLRKIGESRAKELLLTGELYSAENAANFGLINNVVTPSSISDHVLKFARSLSKNNSGDSLRLTKKMIAEVQSRSLENALEYAAEMNARSRETEDCRNGIAAFLDKKTPLWE